MKLLLRVLVGILGLVSFKLNFAIAAADFNLTGVLPKGRHQVTFRFGSTQNVQEKFSSDGSLEGVGRQNIRMDNKFLQGNPQFKDAFQKMNAMNPNEKPADQIDLGALEFKGSAQFNYFTPQIARGVTDRWTVGLAIPVVNFKSNVEAYDSGENTTNTVFKQFSDLNKTGKLSPELAYLRSVLNEGPKSLFNLQTDLAGYKRVESKDVSFIGDVVLGSIYKVKETKYWELHLQNYLTLPTGPKDDPDDLVDCSNFHKRRFETTVYNNIRLSRMVKLGLSAGYIWNMESYEEKRVPRSEEDQLPDMSTKQTVSKDPGDEVVFRSHVFIYPIRDTELGLGYEKVVQGTDDYSGSLGSRYDLLEKNTNSEYDVLKLKATYTTIDSFAQGITPIPLTFTYAFSDILSGTNIERETTHELLMKMYF